MYGELGHFYYSYRDTIGKQSRSDLKAKRRIGISGQVAGNSVVIHPGIEVGLIETR